MLKRAKGRDTLSLGRHGVVGQVCLPSWPRDAQEVASSSSSRMPGACSSREAVKAE